MSLAEFIVPIVVALVSGGGIVALFKMRPEAAQITVQAAEKVVIIQKDEIGRLVDQIDSFRDELDSSMDRIRSLEQTVETLHLVLERTRRERDELAMDKGKLERKVAVLESRVRELERTRGRVEQGVADSLSRIEAQGDAGVTRDEVVASDLLDSQGRADAVEGEPGAAADAASKSQEGN